MGCDGFQYPFDERSNLERFVMWDGDVVLTIYLSRDADVRAILPLELVTQNAQGFDQIAAVNVTGNLHGTRTSSRTK